MKKTNETIKKRIVDTTAIPEKTSQITHVEAATSEKNTTPITAGSSFFGILQKLVCSRNVTLPDDKSEIFFIPKPK